MPHAFLKRVVKDDCKVDLPEPDQYGVGMCFLPNSDKDLYNKSKAIMTKVAKDLGHEVLAWRQVPTDPSNVGPSALATQPVVEQLFLSLSVQETYGQTDVEQQVNIRRQPALSSCTQLQSHPSPKPSESEAPIVTSCALYCAGASYAATPVSYVQQ